MVKKRKVLEERVVVGDVNETKKELEQELTKKSRQDSYTLLLSPDHWPKDVLYLGWHSQPSKKLPLEHQLTFCVAPRMTNENHPIQICAQNWTEVRAINKSTYYVPAYGSDLQHHPAIGQFGLFARKSIPPRTLVIPYFGLAHLAGDEHQDEDEESQYDAAIEADDGTRLGIDATKMGTAARFVNDYRGILQRPNLFFQEWSAAFPKELMSIYRHPTMIKIKPPDRVRGLALFSGAHQIDKGSELCVSYGKGWWAARKK